MKRSLFVLFAGLAVLGGSRFKESLASWEGADRVWSWRMREAASSEAPGRAIVRLTTAESFNRYDLLIWETAASAGIDPNLWKALILVESAGNEWAVSHKGAMGLAQLMPRTARAYGLAEKDAYDPASNLKAGANYLSWLLVRFGGNTKLALAAYNAGPQAVRRHGGIPPYAETQKYVQSIMTLQRWLRNNPDTWVHLRREITPTAAAMPASLRVASAFHILH